MITLADAKLQLNIPMSDTTYDAEIQGYVDGVTAIIERHTGLVMDVTSIAERHRLRLARSFMLNKTPVVELTSVERVDGSATWNVDDLDVDPVTGVVDVMSGPCITGRVEVTYDAGFDVIPSDYKLAAKIIVQSLYGTQRGTAGVPTGGMGDTLDAPGEAGRARYAIPDAALALLGASPPVVY